VHMSSRAGDTIYYMKAKIVEVKGQVFLKIVEKYTTTREIVLELIRKAQVAVREAAEIAQVKMSAAADKTKTAYAERPIAGGAATGAIVLGSAGGATGGVTGGATAIGEQPLKALKGDAASWPTSDSRWLSGSTVCGTGGTS